MMRFGPDNSPSDGVSSSPERCPSGSLIARSPPQFFEPSQRLVCVEKNSSVKKLTLDTRAEVAAKTASALFLLGARFSELLGSW